MQESRCETTQLLPSCSVIPGRLGRAGLHRVLAHATAGSSMVYRRRPRWDALPNLEKELLFSIRPEEHYGMTSYGFKQSLCNGYSHHSRLSLATLECPAQLVTAGQTRRAKSGRLRWGKCQGPALLHNSASVRECLRECSFVAKLHQTHTPLPSKKCALGMPTQFTGQRNCGEPVCVVEQQSDSVAEPLSSGSRTSQRTFNKRNSLKNSCHSSPHPDSVDSTKQNILQSMGHVGESGDGPRAVNDVVFSTEVPHNTTFNCYKSYSRSDTARGDLQNVPDAGGHGLRGKTCAFGTEKRNCVLQDHIRRVVVNLEEVLRGLKEVELEMKEVVTQIDKLTSNIELGEKDTGDASGGYSFSRRPSALENRAHTKIPQVRDIAVHPNGPCGKQTTAQRGGKEPRASTEPPPECTSTPRGPPPAYPSRRSTIVPKSEHGTAILRSNGPKSEASAGPRSKKPPPYPVSNRARRSKKEKDLKSLPHSGKRRLLSTIV
ncbi:uncharacterized protein LOC143528322 [Brachyhypopomus gauderio]|uniref:uncharacterized protein LOC143528322 n=1 Tax=Brachyhypopomus gauderio TaxID=698409 RepID=UPI0040435E80